MQAELIPLARQLHGAERHITVETAGTLYLPVACDLMSISPKLSGSGPSPDRDPRWARRHEASRHVPEVIRRLVADYTYQFKVVVDRIGDCEQVERYLVGATDAAIADYLQRLLQFAREQTALAAAPAGPREGVTFILGQDRTPDNRFYQAATDYYLTDSGARTAHIERNLRCLADVRDYLVAYKAKGREAEKARTEIEAKKLVLEEARRLAELRAKEAERAKMAALAEAE